MWPPVLVAPAGDSEKPGHSPWFTLPEPTAAT